MANKDLIKEKKLLIVDDEYSIREALKLFFTDEGYITTVADNGLEAVKYIEKMDFDAVVSDIRMDKLDGVGLIKKLKHLNKKIPVIFITAYPEYNTAVEALRYGVVEYVTKPFQMKDLEEKVKEAITNKYHSSEEYITRKYREQKKMFLDRFSHELRSPLTPMAAYIQLLLKEEFGEVSDRQMEVLMNVQKNGARLKRLTDDLILLCAIESSEEPIKIEEVGVEQLINKAIKEEDFFIRERNQNVEITVYDGIKTVRCDPVMIGKVLFHLLDNAIKFSPASTDIHFSIRRFRFDRNDYIKFSIKDSSEKLRNINKRIIFREFYEIKRGMDMPGGVKYKGLGIGLTLSRLLVEVHGGRIWLEDDDVTDPSENSNIFSFILPE